MENNSDKILLKGIVRNTAGSICDDGEFEDALNIHYKDGSWRAVNNMDMVKGLESFTNDYSYIYIHSNGYKHALGVKNGALYWFADWDAEKDEFKEKKSIVEICKVKKQEGNIIAIGNMICINFGGLLYKLYSQADNGYKNLKKDFNGDEKDTVLPPEGLIEFRVVDWTEAEEQKVFCTKTNHSFVADGDIYTYGRQPFSSTFKALLSKAEYEVKKEGVIPPSYFYVMYAFRTLSGDYSFYSKPMLMCPTLIGNRNFNVGVTKGASEEADAENGLDFTFDANFTEGKKYYFNTENTIFTVNTTNRHNITDYFSDRVNVIGTSKYKLFPVSMQGFESGNDHYQWNNIHYYNNPYEKGIVYPLYCFYNNTYVFLGLSGVKLQYKPTYDLEEGYANGLVAIDVFISKPISAFLENPAEAENLQYLYDCGIVNEHVEQPIGVPNPSTSFLSNDNSITLSDFDHAVFIKPSVLYEKNEDIKRKLIEDMNVFYKVSSIDLDNIKKKDGWIDIDLKNKLINLETSTVLPIDAYNSRGTYDAKVAFSYNGRLHIASYDEMYFRGFPLNYYFQPESKYQFDVSTEEITAPTDTTKPLNYVEVFIKTDSGNIKVVRYNGNNGRKQVLKALNPLLSYPDKRAFKMNICVNTINGSYTRSFNLTTLLTQNISVYIPDDFKPIKITDTDFSSGIKDTPSEVGNSYNHPNRLKVSEINNPMYFPNTNVYEVGNTEIIGLASNEIALSTGQAGDAPLYVFTKDGIYALFVDASGQLVYSVSRPIARDVCNNPDSIVSIDGAVLFSTDRGLMMIQGSEVTELSANIEGDIKRFLDKENYDYIRQIEQATGHPQLYACQNHMSKDEFKVYLKGAKVGYNHLEREVIVSNKDYDYSYIYKDGYWSKVSYSVEYFVNDYPHLYYAHQGDKKLFDYSREIKKGNDTLMITRPIKLGTQEFKNGFRVVARGRFETQEREPVNLDNNILTIDSCDPIVWMDKLKGIKVKFAQTKTKCHISAKMEYKTGLRVDYIKTDSLKLDLSKTEVVFPISEDVAFNRNDNLYVGGLTDIVLHEDARLIQYNNAIYMRSAIEESANDFIANVENGTYKPYNYNWKQHYGLYVFGSYDCKKFSLLGMQERTGTFRDIGCNIERVDCKYFRIMLIGSLTEESSLEYIEFTAKNKILSKKIR